MTDESRNTYPATDHVGEVSPNIQLVLEEQLADLKQLMETNPASSSTEAAQVGVSILTSEQVSLSFLGCFPTSCAIQYVGGASHSQQPH